MISNINDVPVVFFGFTEEEEKEIRSAIRDKINPGMGNSAGWIAISQALLEASIFNCAFVCSSGISFHKIDGVVKSSGS